MSAETATSWRRLRALGPTLRRPRRPGWPISVWVSLSVFLVICLIVLLAPLIEPHNPDQQVLSDSLRPPSLSHLLGTDELGRDVLSRLMTGGRYSIGVALFTVLIISIVGTFIGATSARIGGRVDELAMRFVDAASGFPEILVALFLVAILGPGSTTVIIALSVTGWTVFARLTRGITLELNTKGYIEAAEALGCSPRFIIVRHILPNAFRPILALALMRFGLQLITVGSLSYLGLGVQPPSSDWGSMLAEGQPYMERDPLLVALPGLAVFITALAVTIAAQGLSRGPRIDTGPTPPATRAENPLTERQDVDV
jgi:ABC-type dipeptide/oligopeptide/nickel transport system permease subunit